MFVVVFASMLVETIVIVFFSSKKPPLDPCKNDTNAIEHLGRQTIQIEIANVMVNKDICLWYVMALWFGCNML